MRIRPPGLILAAALALALALGFFGEAHPFFDSFSHFRLHLAAAAFIVAVVLVAQRLTAIGIGLAAVAIAAAMTTLPDGGNPGAAVAADGTATYRLLQYNLHAESFETNRFLSLVARTDPDIITLQEISEGWRERLTLLDARYPFQVFCAGKDPTVGVMILSRRPFTENPATGCGSAGGFATGRFSINGTPLTVTSVHLDWPWPFKQAEHISALARDFRASGGDTNSAAIMGGDFNAAPWSAAIERIGSLSGMRVVPYLGGTFLKGEPPFFLWRIAGLPIDHVFAGEAIAASVAVLDHGGSDHLPLLAEFRLKNPPRLPERETEESGPVTAMAATANVGS